MNKENKLASAQEMRGIGSGSGDGSDDSDGWQIIN